MSSRPAKRKAAAAAEVKAKRARGETDLDHDLKWSQPEPLLKGNPPLMVLHSETLEGCEKVISFDIDWTIIKTRSGAKFGKDRNDWEWLYEEVPTKLQQLNEEGYRIVFFTNQAGIEKNNTPAPMLMAKFENIIKELDIPIFVFIATGSNHFRKPSTTMWDRFAARYNGGVSVDLSSCMYVGDAAGRPAGWAPDKKKDFSASDRMFAANIGIDFQTPEEFFLRNEAVPFDWHTVDPQDLLSCSSSGAAAEVQYHAKEQEVVVMVGCPASGKSTFCRKYLSPRGYTIVNRDTLGTKQKCLKAAAAAVKEGKKVVIDNTNPDLDSRAEYVKMANKAGVPCRCIHLTTPEAWSHHLNYVRQNMTAGEVRRIPMVAYRVFAKGFTGPTVKEGFSEVLRVPFAANFSDDEHENLFKQWTCSER